MRSSLAYVVGQLATVGVLPNLRRLFYYCVVSSLFIEIIDRKQRDTKHLMKLVDQEGNDIALPEGCRFIHVSSGEEMNLLENHLRELARQ